MRVVFFLGAGFSRSAGFPLMREFSMFSQNMVGFEEHILCLHACIEYAQRTRAYIHGDINNVEYLMSVLALAAITNPDLEFTVEQKTLRVSDALEKLKQLVWRVYSRIEKVSDVAENYRKFVRTLKMFLENKNSSLDIITTNYDLLPEMIMYATGQRATMPVTFERIKSETPPRCASISGVRGNKIYSESETKNLHKLHGSANWFVSENSDSQQVYCWDETFPSFGSDTDLFETPFAVCSDATIPEKYLPIIVPPSMIKEYKIPVILKAWQNASNAIAQADKLIFIGYSFPPSDTIMKFFLGTSLANNRSGCRITVIDKYANNVMKSLNDIFVGDLCKHIDTINCEFENLLNGQGDRFSVYTEFADYLKN